MMKPTLSNEQRISIAQEHGSPVYIYDGNLVRQRYKELFEFIKWPKLKIFYAMKSNNNFGILKLLQQEGSCVDTVSPAEVLVAKEAGFAPDSILYTANNMTDEEIKEVHAQGVLMNFESLTHLDKFGQLFPGSEVCVRLNPDVVAGAYDKIKTGGNLTKFGILLQDVEKINHVAQKHNLKVVGVHEHTGSGINESDSVLQSMKNILEVATKENFPDLRFINFGGGFGVPYKPDEQRVDYAAFGQKVTEIFSAYCQQYGQELEMYFEPGRYIVGEAGSMVVQVNNLKDNRGRIIAGVNAGFPDLIRPMFYGAYHFVTNLSNPEGEQKVYDVVGNICETGDRFAEQREVPEIRVGDYLALETAGAYCHVMGGFYNLRAIPAEVLVDKDSVVHVRKMLTNQELAQQFISESK